MNLAKAEVGQLRQEFETELFEHVLPFWTTFGPDPKHGGVFCCLDRDGRVYDDTKYVWLLARQVWMFGKLYEDVEAVALWREMAERGMDFLNKHARARDSRVYFSLRADGRPIYLQRKLFSEAFFAIALAQYGRICSSSEHMQAAKQLWEELWRWSENLSVLGRPLLAGDQRYHNLAVPMILLNVADEIFGADIFARDQAERLHFLIQSVGEHYSAEHRCVFENRGHEGFDLLTAEGRLLNPGHALEAGWFLLRWAMFLQDESLIKRSLAMIRDSHELGWDQQHGGLYYFLDQGGFAPTQLEWSMKLWWPHCEAMCAHLLAYQASSDQGDWQRFCQVKEYAFTHFPDHKYGEWFGYLHRDGSLSHRFKGGPYKGCFHVPRSLWLCWRLLQRIEEKL